MVLRRRILRFWSRAPLPRMIRRVRRCRKRPAHLVHLMRRRAVYLAPSSRRRRSPVNLTRINFFPQILIRPLNPRLRQPRRKRPSRPHRPITNYSALISMLPPRLLKRATPWALRSRKKMSSKISYPSFPRKTLLLQHLRSLPYTTPFHLLQRHPGVQTRLLTIRHSQRA